MTTDPTRPAPIFVVGTPRSGTTLVRLLLDSHPDLAIAPESAFFLRLVGRCGPLYRDLCTPAAVRGLVEDALSISAVAAWFPRDLGPEAVLARLGGHPTPAEVTDALYSAWASHRGKARWGDKTPRNLQHIGALLDLFPAARIVIVMRDPRDIAVSLAKASFAGTSAIGAALRWATDAACARDALATAGDAAWVLPYEGLVREPERWCAELLSFVRAPPCPDLLDRYRHHRDDVSHALSDLYLQPVDAAAAQRWRVSGPPEVIAQVEAVVGEELARWGYEPSLPAGRVGRRARLRARVGDALSAARNREYMTNYRDLARLAARRIQAYPGEG